MYFKLLENLLITLAYNSVPRLQFLENMSLYGLQVPNLSLPSGNYTTNRLPNEMR